MHQVRPPQAGCLEHSIHVPQRRPGLLGNATVDQLAGCGIESHLPRRKQKSAGPGGLAVGADGTGSLRGRDESDRHQKSPSIVPSGCTRMASAEGVLESPGMVMISPASATTNPAPADAYTSRTVMR